ncbi:MAG: ATPase, T2SS/T4P/T4SS family [Candidatus Omnitrophota bacterium]
MRKNKLIGEILVGKGLITSVQVNRALEFQKKEGGYICTLIARRKFAPARDVFKALSCQLNIEYVDLKEEKLDLKAIEKVPVKLALHYEFMPYKFKDGELVIVLSDPLDVRKIDDLSLLLDQNIKPVLGYEADILESIQKHYGVGANILEEMMSRSDTQAKIKPKTVEELETVSQDASIIEFVNKIFVQAVDERATDIHLEPYENELRVRFRIDGFLYDVPIPESIKLFHQAIVSRIKIMSGLDIAEHRFPQDGRIKIKVKDEELDLRVSILPSPYGETVQVRILNTKSFMSLDNLGLLGDDREVIENLVNKPYGIVFVTGPTGSGKSTTLYAYLRKKNVSGIKIVTTEDPIEYQLRGITQIQVNPKIGLTFAEGLRRILRHDPDIIMVGEVRDTETAEITIRSAMTGHLVFSTLHTNDAASAPVRLVDMDIEPFLVASSLEGVIAQRLVRVVCPKCKEKVSISADIFRKEGVAVKEDSIEVFKGKGCQNCRWTGFKGRTAIFEILVVNAVIRDLIFKRAASQTIKEKAIKNGMRTLRQDGLTKVLAGITTLDEVMRVT